MNELNRLNDGWVEEVVLSESKQSFIHWFIHSFIHLFTHSLTHSPTHMFIH